MNNSVDGNTNNPAKRNMNAPAARQNNHPVNQRKAPQNQGRIPQRTMQQRPVAASKNQAQRPVQRPVQKPAQRPVQKQVQRPVQKQGQKPVQRKVQKQVKKQVPNGQQRPSQKTVQRAPQKKTVQKPSQNPASQISLVKPIIIGIVVILLAVAGFVCYSFLNDQWDLLINENTIEAGTTKPEIKMYFKEEPAIEKLVSCNLNFDEVNTNLPQTVNFNIQMYGKNFPCRLVIKDTVAPVGEGVAQKIFASQTDLDPSTCVQNIQDVTDVSVTWKDFPDISNGGKFMAYALLTDAAGNESVVGVPLDVTKDSTAPVLKGAQDITVYIGESIQYRKNIIVTDDYDDNPVLSIDTSAVNRNKAGKYDVVYTATDFSGNSSSVTVKLKISEKPKGYIEPDVVYKEAKKILEQITEPGMTEEEVALQIVWWCRYNIRFILRTKSSSWTEAAYNAYTKRTGNCYSTACAVKALLDVAGIDNMMIERFPYQTATHFWNYVKINGQWYHCDATWRQNYDSYFFMYTTKELLNFWHDGWNGFQFKQSAFPESATESVQKRIDYKNHKIKAA